MFRTVGKLGCVALLGGSLTLLGLAAPAQATTIGVACDAFKSLALHVDRNNGSTTENGQCGTVSVQIGYKIYAGSNTYYSNWVYGSSVANINSTNQIVVGHHDATQCSLLFPCGPWTTYP